LLTVRQLEAYVLGRQQNDRLINRTITVMNWDHFILEKLGNLA